MRQPRGTPAGGASSFVLHVPAPPRPSFRGVRFRTCSFRSQLPAAVTLGAGTHDCHVYHKVLSRIHFCFCFKKNKLASMARVSLH